MGFSDLPTAASQLRALLARDGVLMAVGTDGPLPAKLVEEAGFCAVYMPGGGVALSHLGVADVGLLTLGEMAQCAGAIARSVGIPVIADADTGFGNIWNVRRTVREFEREGIAAIHIEDQVFPKRCGHLAGKALIPLEEAAQKIRAAVAARSNPDFMIIARCDALSIGGFGEVQLRCAAYRAAGADMLFVNGLTNYEDIARVPRDIPGYHVFNMASGGQVPKLGQSELSGLGYKLMIMPNFATLAAIKAVQSLLTEIRRTGSVATIADRCASFSEFTRLGGLDELDAFERETLVSRSKAQNQ